MTEDAAGPTFPFRIDPATGGVAWASGADKIRQDVRLVLGTQVGERPMLRDFGSKLHALVHEPNDDALSTLLSHHAQEVLLQWEPRILALQAQVEQLEGEVHLRLTYTNSDQAVSGELIVPIL